MNEWVLDTSALVAGLLARRGAAARLVDAVFSGALRPVYKLRLLQIAQKRPEVLLESA